MASPYTAPSRDAWFSVGLASSYINVTASDDLALAEQRSCSKGGNVKPGCKVFLVPEADGSNTVVELSHDPNDQLNASLRKGEQVLVFQYNDKFHAMDNKCPHSSYPLSDATPFDIEDFGVALSAGITCPKHGWSFDLFTGQSDRGNYKLKRWEVQLRSVAEGEDKKHDSEVWVRKRQRIG